MSINIPAVLTPKGLTPNTYTPKNIKTSSLMQHAYCANPSAPQTIILSRYRKILGYGVLREVTALHNVGEHDIKSLDHVVYLHKLQERRFVLVVDGDDSGCHSTDQLYHYKSTVCRTMEVFESISTYA